jgi:cytochrome oxidase assembly protein ShyY1
VYRFLLSPRWLAFHLLVLAAIPVCALFARWQYDRYSERTAAEHAPSAARSAPAVPLATLLPAGANVTTASWDRLVTVRGQYDPREYLVPARQQGADGYFVVALLRRADGPAVPVNQGFLAAPSGRDPVAPPAPTGEVSVQGRLEPPDDPSEVGASGLPAGQLPLISPAILVNEVNYPIANGYLVRTAGPMAAPLAPTIPPTHRVSTGDTVGPWQNLAYVVQWWAFAVVILGLWLRITTRELRQAKERAMDAAIAELATTSRMP